MESVQCVRAVLPALPVRTAFGLCALRIRPYVAPRMQCLHTRRPLRRARGLRKCIQQLDAWGGDVLSVFTKKASCIAALGGNRLAECGAYGECHSAARQGKRNVAHQSWGFGALSLGVSVTWAFSVGVSGSGAALAAFRMPK